MWRFHTTYYNGGLRFGRDVNSLLGERVCVGKKEEEEDTQWALRGRFLSFSLVCAFCIFLLLPYVTRFVHVMGAYHPIYFKIHACLYSNRISFLHVIHSMSWQRWAHPRLQLDLLLLLPYFFRSIHIVIHRTKLNPSSIMLLISNTIIRKLIEICHVALLCRSTLISQTNGKTYYVAYYTTKSNLFISPHNMRSPTS